MTPDAALKRLRTIGAELRHLEHAAVLLSWDQETSMPARGFAARGAAIGFLRAEIRERWASVELARLVDQLDGCFDAGSVEQGLIALCRRQHELALRLTPELVARRAQLSSEARPIWRQARATADWELYAPVVQRVVDLNVEVAETIGYAERPYDAMLELHEPGVTTREIDGYLTRLRDTALSLLPALRAERAPSIGELLPATWARAGQLEFIAFVARSVGFDENAGRIDESAYPIANAVGLGDVRVTTNVQEDRPLRAFFGALHEVGHGLYAQGMPAALAGLPLWGHPTIGVDESQSRLWETNVGRSRGFWRHFLPHFKSCFPGTLESLDAETFYRAVNRPLVTPYRLDADELTANLHILLRFEIENELLEGTLAVADIPAAWADRARRYLDVEVVTAAEGPLQDIHWAGCYIGSFTSYTVGDLIAAQLVERVRESVPDLDEQVEAGEFSMLRAWLAKNVYAHGAALTQPDLMRLATGSELSADPWVRYAEAKFGELAGSSGK